MAVLIGFQSAIGRRAAIDAVEELGLPEDLVATHEGEIDARIGRCLNIRHLAIGPVLVMSDVHEDLVVEEQRTVRRGIHPGDIGNVVAVLLQPIDRGIFSAEYTVLHAAFGSGRVVCCKRAIVTDRICGAQARLPIGNGSRSIAAVQICPAPAVVSFPCFVGGLKNDVAVGARILDDERDLENLSGVADASLDNVGDIHARHGVRRDVPGIGDRPIACVHQTRGGIDDRIRLYDGG